MRLRHVISALIRSAELCRWRPLPSFDSGAPGRGLR